MAGSRGAASWAKRFQGRGDIETVMKKDSKVYDLNNDSRIVGSTEAGTKVTYLASDIYEPKSKVALKGFDTPVRVTFDNIQKPGLRPGDLVSLKPQAFNIASETKRWTLSEYNKKVYNAIESREDLKSEVKSYLYCLMEYYNGDKSKKELESIYENVKKELPINNINKDFGEVIGPIGIINRQLFSDKGIRFSNSSRIYVPPRPNEPLMDYGIEDKGTTYVISAKSGKTTNTVKPQDILGLLAKDEKKNRFWKNTKQYKILNILSRSTAVMGPIRAVAELYPNLIDKKIADKTEKNSFKAENFLEFISKNDFLSKQKNPTATQVTYECEKIIMEESKTSKLDMTDIFKDAIENKVIYVRFEIGRSGSGIWEVTMSDDIITKGKKVSFRSKNSRNNAGDKLGLQP